MVTENRKTVVDVEEGHGQVDSARVDGGRF